MSRKHKYSEFGYMRAADGRSWRPLASGPFAPRETPGREPVKVGIKPECEGCKIGAHGFMCHFADGSCLRLKACVNSVKNDSSIFDDFTEKTIHGKGGQHNAVGNAGTIAASQAG